MFTSPILECALAMIRNAQTFGDLHDVERFLAERDVQNLVIEERLRSKRAKLASVRHPRGKPTPGPLVPNKLARNKGRVPDTHRWRNAR